MAPGQVRKMAELCDSGYILWRFLSCLRAIFENFSSQIVVKFCRTDSSRRNGEVTAIHLQRGCCPCYQPSGESRHSLSAKGVMAFLLGGERSPYSAESSVGKPFLSRASSVCQMSTPLWMENRIRASRGTLGYSSL